jgi:hypothetical protein
MSRTALTAAIALTAALAVAAPAQATPLSFTAIEFKNTGLAPGGQSGEEVRRPG